MTKQRKSKSLFVLTALLVLAFVFSIFNMLNIAKTNKQGNMPMAHADDINELNVTMSETKYKKSADKEYLLLVTAFEADEVLADTENSYLIGYEINSQDVFENNGKKYYESVSLKTSETESVTYTAKEIFNNDSYESYFLNVYELANYDETKEYTISSFIKQIVPNGVDGYTVVKASLGESYTLPAKTFSVNWNAVSSDEATIVGASSVKSGEDYTITVTPKEGYGVYVYNGETKLDSSDNVYTIENVSADVNLSIVTYSLSLPYGFESTAWNGLYTSRSEAWGVGAAISHSTDYAHSGQRSLKISSTNSWKAFDLNMLDLANDKADWIAAGYTHIRFYVYTSVASTFENRSFRVAAYEGNPIGANISTDGTNWKEVTIALSDERVAGSGLFFFTGATNDIYIDDISLVCIEGTTLPFTFEGEFSGYTAAANLSPSGAETTVTITDEVAHSGNKSLKLSNTAGFKHIVFSSLDVANNKEAWIAAGYTHIRFYVYTSVASGAIECRFWRAGAYSGNPIGANISIDGTNWKEVTIALSDERVAGSGLFFFTSATNDIYIDDISLVKMP